MCMTLEASVQHNVKLYCSKGVEILFAHANAQRQNDGPSRLFLRLRTYAYTRNELDYS